METEMDREQLLGAYRRDPRNYRRMLQESDAPEETAPAPAQPKAAEPSKFFRKGKK